MLNVTDDAWFGLTAGPYQHFAQARLRAIETGLPLVRAANTGISAIIDGRGRILAEAPLGAEAVLDGALPEPLPPTWQRRWGSSTCRLDRPRVSLQSSPSRAGRPMKDRVSGELSTVARNARIG